MNGIRHHWSRLSSGAEVDQPKGKTLELVSNMLS